jgi:transcriptional regulator with XRE-family HTH domain
MMENAMPHYTSQNTEVFVERITSDFIGQIARLLETSDMSQIELAQRLGVSESEVSQVLNLNRVNLTLKKMALFAQALGRKVAVVVYDDQDPLNERGPVGSEIFSQSWERTGRPRRVLTSFNTQSAVTISNPAPAIWPYGWMNSTAINRFGTAGQFPEIPIHLLTQREEATHARI